MEILRQVWINIWDLLIEDGWIAGGTVGSLITIGILPLVISEPIVSEIQGPLLFVLLMTLLLVNLYGVGRRLRGSAELRE